MYRLLLREDAACVGLSCLNHQEEKQIWKNILHQAWEWRGAQ